VLLYEKEERDLNMDLDTEKHTGEGNHVKTEAEIGMPRN
jgi:hypothetical protein